MSSTAISAQGTIVQIATGTGGAKTITAMAAGNPTIFTSSAHGLSNGDAITIASVTGTAATTVNVATTVMYKTTNTFAVPLDTTGLAYTSGGTATPATYTAIANVRAVNDLESGSNSEIDVTNLSSTAREFRLSLPDNGTFSLTCDHNNADAGQAALVARRADAAVVAMKVILPSGTTPTASFNALVKKFAKSAAVDGVVAATVDVRVTGPVTWS